jgi:hypothetical protein
MDMDGSLVVVVVVVWLSEGRGACVVWTGEGEMMIVMTTGSVGCAPVPVMVEFWMG